MKKFFKSTYFAIILAFIYVPIAVMIVFSFNSGDTVFSFISFSGKWYTELVHNQPFLKSILTSLFVAVVSTLISLLIGVAAAIGLSRTKPITQKAWVSIANIPLINADVVTAVSLMVVFLLLGFRFGIGTLILAHISFNVPYVLITVMPRLRKVDKSLLEAASDLGAKNYQVLFRVVLPVLKPAIITAAVIAFSMSFDDFIISYFTGGDQTNVSTFIYTARRVRPYIFAFGTLLVAFIVFGVLIWNTVLFIKDKKKRTIEEIKNDTYKAKELNRQYKKLEKLYNELNNQTRTYVSKNPLNWNRYWHYKLLVKFYSIKNFDRRISKLEWKQYKIKNEIRNEKRYYTMLQNTNKSIERLEKDVEKKSVDVKNVKRVAKLQLRLEKLYDKRDFLESEIDAIENQNQKAAEKVARLNRKILALEAEFAEQRDHLSKKDVNWYTKKLKQLYDYKIELEEGKNHYKLRMVVDELRQTRDLRNNKIYELKGKLDQSKKKVYIKKPITQFYYQPFKKKAAKQLAQENYMVAELNKIEIKIQKIENKIDAIGQEIEKKKQKILPPPDDESNEVIKSKGFFARSWKIITASTLGIAAFTGLTVAYVQNNIYDLTVGNWGEYIDPKLIGKFQKETGYRVNYQVYDSNETLYNKLFTFTYDLMVPSDYMIDRLYQEDKLRKFDPAVMDEAKFTRDGYASWLADQPYKEGGEYHWLNYEVNFFDYSVPYFWGDVAILFNTNRSGVNDLLMSQGAQIDETSHTATGVNWEIIKAAVDRGMQVSLNSDPKNLFLIGNMVMNHEVNSQDKTQVNKAFDYLKPLIHPGNVSIQGDDMIASIVNGNFDVAVLYSGDAVAATQSYVANNSGMFTLARPDAGTNIYFDSMVISTQSTHQLATFQFMNFMRQNSAANSEYVGLASPYQAVLDELKTTTFKDFASWYQPSDKGRPYVYNKTVDPYLIEKYNDLLASK